MLTESRKREQRKQNKRLEVILELFLLHLPFVFIILSEHSIETGELEVSERMCACLYVCLCLWEYSYKREIITHF